MPALSQDNKPKESCPIYAERFCEFIFLCPFIMLTSLPPLSLYIHLPWCIRKCPYCDFNSHALKTELPEERYVDLLLADLAQDLTWVTPRPLTSIFFGGGTPSLFSAKAIQRLLDGVRMQLDWEKKIEITLEANPGTAEQEKFAGFHAAGVNRLSLGIQSFQDEKLKALGRIHNGENAQQAISLAKSAGFSNFNLDLMHGLPNQTITDALYDLTTALSFSPTHLSWYQLTLEPHTAFYQKPPTLPTEEVLQGINIEGEQQLLNHQYQHYEISAYAQSGKTCKHNLNYWNFGDYLGIGAGAHGKITDLNNNQIIRYQKIKHPKEYLAAKNCYAQKEVIASERLPFEFMLNALRLTQPLALELFKNRTGLSLTAILPALEQARKKQLLEFDEGFLKITALGKRFLNDLLLLFI